MHNYNIANRYVSQTRMGNWYEEEALKQNHFKDYLKNKTQNNLLTINKQDKIQYLLQPNQYLQNTKGELHYGDRISLFNYKTQGTLAFNLYEKVIGEQAYAVTTAKNSYPCLRNVFTIEHLDKNDNKDLIKYGDKFRLVTQVSNDLKVYLQSLTLAPTRCSKFSKNQQVSVGQIKNANTIWCFENINPKNRFQAKGEIVNLNQDILLKHILTGQWLASDLVPYLNQFGDQFEVFAKSMIKNNKTQNLFAQKVGHISVQVALRQQHQQNAWRILI